MPKARAFRKPIQAKRTDFNGVTYDSKAEAKRAEALEADRLAGRVVFVFRQVKADIGDWPAKDRPYRVDFLVLTREADGRIAAHAEDVKGSDTPEFRRHLKQWAVRGCIPLHTIRRGKLESVLEGGRDFIPSRHDYGRTVNGVKYRNLALADHALHLDAERSRGDVLAWYRDVYASDFLVLRSGPSGVAASLDNVLAGRPVSTPI